MIIWKYIDVGYSQDVIKKLKEFFDNLVVFDYFKLVDLIKRIIELYLYNDLIVFDFFLGFVIIVYVVMELNNERNMLMKYIMVQLLEKISEKFEQFLLGYKIMLDVGIDRIKKVVKKIKDVLEVLWINLDVGFRVLKLDLFNMNDVYYNLNEIKQDLLE